MERKAVALSEATLTREAKTRAVVGAAAARSARRRSAGASKMPART